MTAVFDTSASLVDRIRSQVGDLNDQIEYEGINFIFLRELNGWINTIRIPEQIMRHRPEQYFRSPIAPRPVLIQVAYDLCHVTYHILPKIPKLRY